MNFKLTILHTMKVLRIYLVRVFFECGHMNRNHKICNGLYLELVAPISSIVR